jgi:hypothetical protein
MALVAPTAASFKVRYPEFAAVSDAAVTAMLAEATVLSRFGLALPPLRCQSKGGFHDDPRSSHRTDNHH